MEISICAAEASTVCGNQDGMRNVKILVLYITGKYSVNLLLRTYLLPLFKRLWINAQPKTTCERTFWFMD